LSLVYIFIPYVCLQIQQGFVDKQYPLQNCHEADEAEVEIFGLVVTRGDTPPVVEFVEQALDEVALAVIFAVLGDGLWIGVQKGPR